MKCFLKGQNLNFHSVSWSLFLKDDDRLEPQEGRDSGNARNRRTSDEDALSFWCDSCGCCCFHVLLGVSITMAGDKAENVVDNMTTVSFLVCL